MYAIQNGYTAIIAPDDDVDVRKTYCYYCYIYVRRKRHYQYDWTCKVGSGGVQLLL